MNTTQWVVFSIILLVFFVKANKTDAFILLCTYLYYIEFIIPLSDIYYYSGSALLNLGAGLSLHFINKNAAICSYLLVPLNVIGYLLWYKYYPPTIYDNIALLILVLQLVTLLPKGALNGLRYNCKYIMAKSTYFNSN